MAAERYAVWDVLSEHRMVWGRNAQGDGVKRMKEVKELFADANEKECSVLGEGYLYKFLTDDVLYRGFCVMTDRRLYFKGKYFQKVGRKFRPDKGEYTIDLKDVTSSGFTTARFGIVFFLEILFVIVMTVLTALFLRFVEVVDHFYFGDETIIESCLVLMALGLIAVPFYYYLKPFKAFVIEYAGGGIAFLVPDYFEEDARMFQKALHRAKDLGALAKDSQAAVKDSQVPVEGIAASGVCRESVGPDGLSLAQSAE